jgi:hypothetical protein
MSHFEITEARSVSEHVHNQRIGQVSRNGMVVELLRGLRQLVLLNTLPRYQNND